MRVDPPSPAAIGSAGGLLDKLGVTIGACELASKYQLRDTIDQAAAIGVPPVMPSLSRHPRAERTAVGSPKDELSLINYGQKVAATRAG